MTKKAEHEARVAANKRAAYLKRVSTLLGHVYDRRSILSEIETAFEIGEKAEDVAAIIASREPVGKAVHPLKVHSVAEAEKWALGYAAKVKEELEAVSFDVDSIAPYPQASKLGGYGHAYEEARAKYSRFHRFVQTERGSYSLRGEKTYVWVESLVTRFVQNAKEEAAAQYDGFICKLVAKVGPCDEASLEGNHVWSHSILTVRKGQVFESWKTQQITNVSVLGKYFPQWPTRLIGRVG